MVRNYHDPNTDHDCYLIVLPLCSLRSLSSARTLPFSDCTYHLVLRYGRKETVFRQVPIII